MHLHRFPRRTSGLILAILAILGTSVQAQTYRLTDLGSINTNPQTGQTISHAAGINSAGQVAGHSYSGPSIHAARFTNGLVEDLGAIPGGDRSYGIGINDSGQVVGDSQYDAVNGCCRHAALFSSGTVTDLGFLPGWGNYSRAHGINQAGEVVGYSGPDNPTASPSPTRTRAFIWDATNGMRDLGTLGGAGYSKALSINNSGLVTGEARTATSGGSHAFIWDATGGMRDIGTIAGDFSVGNSINANGHVVGKSTINTFDNRDHAFFYDGTTMHDLGSLGTGHFFSDRSVAYGINIHDHVVGGTYRLYTGGALYGIPFIYRDGQMYDLTTLVDASGDDYQLGYATGINDAGQIAINQSIKRSTNEIHAVLLTPNDTGTPTPTPEPTATPTPSSSPTPTPATTPTPNPTPTPTATPSTTPTPNPTPTATATPATTPTPNPTPEPTATPETTPTPAPTPEATATPGGTPTPTPPAQAINLSTRMRVQTGDNVGIGGFIITGSAPKQLLLRAIGPSLAQFGVPDVLADPMLELHGPGTFVTVTNDNWKDNPAQQIQIQATGIAPTSDLESAIHAMLDPGTYTAILRGNGSNATGVALIEVYDLNQPASSKLDNISTRALISTGDNIVIAGFMLSQGGTDKVVVRGLGPSLTSAGVPNAVADPTLELRDTNGALLVANNDWQDDPIQASQLTSVGLAPARAQESGIAATLPPGLYTALLTGRNNGTGVGLVEVYDRVAP